jgi:hypothetical protein
MTDKEELTMFARRRTLSRNTLSIVLALFGIALLSKGEVARAIHIVVDYRYDTNNFFNTQQKVAALADVGWSVIEPIEDESGDFNDDGTVDAADYVTWRKGLGTIYTAEDYELWRANFGASLGSGSAAVQNAVPEPAEICLIAVAGMVCLFNRRYVALCH